MARRIVRRIPPAQASLSHSGCYPIARTPVRNRPRPEKARRSEKREHKKWERVAGQTWSSSASLQMPPPLDENESRTKPANNAVKPCSVPSHYGNGPSPVDCSKKLLAAPGI